MPKGLNSLLETRLLTMAPPADLPPPEPFAPGPPTPPGFPIDSGLILLLFVALVFAFLTLKKHYKKTPA